MSEHSARSAREADPTLLRLKLFGQMEARTLGGESVLPVGGKTRALLAILALSDRKPVLRSRLAELLWSRRPDEMARASLRQEIHRLQDVLSPLGVEVIDVQRHSLALKPALTSVDTERVLNSTSRSLENLPSPDEILLGELTGLDPAFDDWLEEQRHRLTQHLHMLHEAFLRDCNDLEQAEEVANRLLKLDEHNEAAWRVRIQTALQKGEQARATYIAEQLLERCGDKAYEQMLAPATCALVASIFPKNEQHQTKDDISPEVFSETGVPLPGPGSLFETANQRPDPLLRPPLQFEGKSVFPLEQRISVLILSPFGEVETPGQEMGFLLGDQLEEFFVQMDVFNVIAWPEDFSPDPLNAVAAYRALGADYVISGVLRGRNGGTGRLVLRIMDIRGGGGIVWGTHYDFPLDELLAAAEGLASPAEAMQWGILLVEARRTATRAEDDLSPLGWTLRAFLLFSRYDVRLFPGTGKLLEKAVEKAPDNDFITFLYSLHCYFWHLNEWDNAERVHLQRGIEAARAKLVLQPVGAGSNLLLAACLLLAPDMRPFAVSIAQAVLSAQEEQESIAPSSHLCIWRMTYHLTENDFASAAVIARDLLRNPYRSPFVELLKPCIMKVLLFAGDYQEVISLGRLMAGLYPNYPVTLVYYLIALVEEGGKAAEIAQVRNHLLRLVPGLTVRKILAHLSNFPTGHHKVLEQGLLKGGLAAG
ncbi:hypothetical protein [Gluconobacter morbifer]|nr:hypothetical protein [Gluconobacter morbifer]